MIKTATYLVVLVHTLHLIFAAISNYNIPYVVSLQKEMADGSLVHYCGGTLITPSHVVTAAYCCDGVNISTVYVKAGVRNLRDYYYGELQQAEWCNAHDNYTVTGSDDIAIIRVLEPFTLDGLKIATIYAENSYYLPDDIDVLLYGWNPSLKYAPNYIQYFEYKTIANSECLEKTSNQVLTNDLCAENMRINYSGNAFSGSPLIVKTSFGPTQVGIFRHKTLLEPIIFTRISPFTAIMKSIRLSMEQIV